MKLRDIIFIVSILASAFLSLIIININKEPGEGVIVKIDGIQVAQYSLSIDAEYELNGGTNILIIQNGEAWLIDANCPDQLCVRQGKISYNGETITCLPNKLTITVYGDGEVIL